MTIAGVPISQMSFGQWWMFGSAVLVLVGFVGWRLAHMMAGAKSVINHQDEVAEHSVLNEAPQTEHTVIRDSKTNVSKGAAVSNLGAFFLHLLLGSLAAHIAFWVYAGIWMRG